MKELTGQKEIILPKVGSKLYVQTSLYIGHGQDDFEGGLATIEEIEEDPNLPKDHYNYYMVRLKERPGWCYNLRYLLEEQKKLKKEYKGKIAHPDPDDRMEFNTGY